MAAKSIQMPERLLAIPGEQITSKGIATAENDPFFVKKAEASSSAKQGGFFEAFNALMQEERKKAAHCLSRIAHDKTRAQMTLFELKKTNGTASNKEFSQNVDAHEAFIQRCSEQTQVIKARLFRLEKGLKDISLSCPSEKSLQNAVLPRPNQQTGLSQNQSGFWQQKAKPTTISTPSLPTPDFSPSR